MLSLVSSWYVVFYLHVSCPTSSPCPEVDRKTEAQKGGHLCLGRMGHVEKYPLKPRALGETNKNMKKTRIQILCLFFES